MACTHACLAVCSKAAGSELGRRSGFGRPRGPAPAAAAAATAVSAAARATAAVRRIIRTDFTSNGTVCFLPGDPFLRCCCVLVYESESPLVNRSRLTLGSALSVPDLAFKDWAADAVRAAPPTSQPFSPPRLFSERSRQRNFSLSAAAVASAFSASTVTLEVSPFDRCWPGCFAVRRVLPSWLRPCLGDFATSGVPLCPSLLCSCGLPVSCYASLQ